MFVEQPQRSGLRWRTASSCGGGACVQVAATNSGVAVRDSKDVSGPMLHYTPDEWREFIEAAKRGEFDSLE